MRITCPRCGSVKFTGPRRTTELALAHILSQKDPVVSRALAYDDKMRGLISGNVGQFVMRLTSRLVKEGRLRRVAQGVFVHEKE